MKDKVNVVLAFTAKLLSVTLVGVVLCGGIFVRPVEAAANGGYPWASADPGVHSPLRFYNRNCTDFAAWKINQQLGYPNGPWAFTWGSLDFPIGSDGRPNGNAIGWKQGAINSGYKVDGTPKVGSIAWWGNGDYGHVAVVQKINTDGSVAVEEYNQNWDYKYSVRPSARAQAYLHIADAVKPSISTQAGPVWSGVEGATFLGSNEFHTGQVC